mmetsp:Transcript_16157/g.38392  ORF Transcript_16157/g.38392 Transcript_16157/m.38392 type:complete len:137 (+) Transcript_16157:157-567(+)
MLCERVPETSFMTASLCPGCQEVPWWPPIVEERTLSLGRPCCSSHLRRALQCESTALAAGTLGELPREAAEGLKGQRSRRTHRYDPATGPEDGFNLRQQRAARFNQFLWIHMLCQHKGKLQSALLNLLAFAKTLAN